jgi:ribosome biogenesis GTPase A
MQQPPPPPAPSNIVKSTVASIVNRDNFSNNRELVTDKASLIASLNNTQNNVNNNSNNHSPNNHLYQNVQQITTKPFTNGNSNGYSVSNGTANGVGDKKPIANGTNGIHHSNGDVEPIKSNGVTANLSKQKTLDGYVGFANLPNQVYRKAVKKGFEFNLMVIGESGLGKSTFINSLFLTELYNPNEFPGTFERKKKTTFVDSTSVLLSEKGVNLRLTIVDTPGFGESIDNTNCWQPIIDYIDNKYEEYLNAESKVNRKLPINDQRIHCCLHFIAPGHT